MAQERGFRVSVCTHNDHHEQTEGLFLDIKLFWIAPPLYFLIKNAFFSPEQKQTHVQIS